MPISVEWDDRQGIWLITVDKFFQLDELTELVEQTDWGKGRRFLWDLRSVEKGPDGPGELRQAAQVTRRAPHDWQGWHGAIVVSRDFDFGIARMFQVFMEGSGIEYSIFRDLESAFAWLRDRDLTRPL